jgi:hypothetical protein
MTIELRSIRVEKHRIIIAFDGKRSGILFFAQGLLLPGNEALYLFCTKSTQ